MKKIVLSGFILMLFSVAVVGMFIRSTVACTNQNVSSCDEGKFVSNSSKTIWVPDDFTSIQEAVNNASDGYTIFIRADTYHENVILNKPDLTLIGENKHTTVIDGNGETVVSLKANNTKIEGFTLQNGRFGIVMSPWTHGHIISSNVILNNDYGVSGHYDCVNVSICDNTITSNNIAGIIMLFSHSVISNNLISDNGKGEYKEYGSGIQIWRGSNSKIIYCVNNTIFSNTIRNHQIGICPIHYSEGNLFFHNNFVNNTKQFPVSTTVWNNTIIENYWTDYNGTDLYNGPNQNETGSDGIGDIPYDVGGTNQDVHPLMGAFSDFPVTHGEESFHITTVCSSTVSEFQFNDVAETISFNVTGPDYSLGFCRVSVPNIIIQDLWQGNYTVLLDEEQPLTIRNWTDVIYTYIYFTYLHSEHKVEMIHEFPTWKLMSLIFIALTVAIVIYTRRLDNNSNHLHMY